MRASTQDASQNVAKQERDVCGRENGAWVFGYGSLMWRPGFEALERRIARIEGHHRALCVYSHVHRGTPDKPGLVLGLDVGGRCEGVAYHVAPERWEATLAYLRERELVTNVYREIWTPATLDDGRRVEALAYVIDQSHPQYASGLDRAAALELVRQGVGVSGANVDYVCSTVDHLAEIGVRDDELNWIATELRKTAGEKTTASR
jgi:cation transport protein ChaC